MLTPPSIKDLLENTAYEDAKGQAKLKEAGYRYDEEDYMSEVTALYFAMIEEVDVWVGELLDTLAQTDMESRTLIVFSSDHGTITC